MIKSAITSLANKDRSCFSGSEVSPEQASMVKAQEKLKRAFFPYEVVTPPVLHNVKNMKNWN